MDDELLRERVLGWDQALDQSSYYEILGVDARADDAAVREAFHGFALAFHPDQHQSVGEALAPAIRRIFQRGAEAYRVLSRPEWRLRYDMALSRGHLRLEPGDIPRQATSDASPLPLDALARSAYAKLAAKRADRLIGNGDLAAAKAELMQALEYDGNANPALAERLDALELAVFAMGDDE